MREAFGDGVGRLICDSLIIGVGGVGSEFSM